MHLELITIRKSLNKAYLRDTINRADFDNAIQQFRTLLKNIDQAEEAGESEEHLKNFLTPFFKKSGFDDFYINTDGRTDLAIHNDKKKKDPVGVMIETKRPGSPEMITKEQPNRKALHEAILYYMRERIEKENTDEKHIIITDLKEWFIFDAQEFDRHFYRSGPLKKEFIKWQSNQKSSSNTALMYELISNYLVNFEKPLKATHFSLTKFRKLIEKEDRTEEEERKLIPLIKLLSPVHLLKQSFTNDSNSLDRGFYNELLYIIGLQEKERRGPKLIGRLQEGERQTGSFIENTIATLRYENRMRHVSEPAATYGAKIEDQLFGVALELCILWINRILFLKLLEAQLYKYHREDEHFKFLNYGMVDEFDELNKLFFRVLAVKEEEREEREKEKYGHIPYLNSSLFDIARIEDQTTRISGLDDKVSMPVYSRTVLKDKKGKSIAGREMNTLEYLFRFLDAYNFSAEGKEDIQEEDKSLINASVLGLIFEKINGYKDGSFYTPGFITEYMCRETLRKSVVDKFNDRFDWNCEEFDELYNQIHRAGISLKEANEVVNSIKVCDPAVGSGHFLVSALNEFIAIKSALGIFCDNEYKLFRSEKVQVENDELVVTYGDDQIFEYSLSGEWQNDQIRRSVNRETQRLQKALFEEKRQLIENNLFGVDINANSVKICRLRLWIELLKHAYYKEDDHFQSLEVLPNIDINIKQGNSLVSRFELDVDLEQILKEADYTLEDYKSAVHKYKETRDQETKRELRQLIREMKNAFTVGLEQLHPERQKLKNNKAELLKEETQQELFEETSSKQKNIAKLRKKVQKQQNVVDELETGRLFRNSFEWRFEFPELLDENANFIGFDIVIGNPPYDVLEKNRNEPLKPYKDLRSYINNSGKYDPVLGGKVNIYRLFIFLMINITHISSRIAFITQLSLLADTSLAKTRKFIFNHLDEIIFDCFPQKDNPNKRIFQEAKVSTVISQGKVSHSNRIKTICNTYPLNSFKDKHKSYNFHFEDLKLIDEKYIPIPLVDIKEWKIIYKIYNNISVSKLNDIDNIVIRRGEINQTTYKDFITYNKNNKKLLKGAEISQFFLNDEMSQGDFMYFNEKKFLDKHNAKDVVDNRRIATQRITGVDEDVRIVGAIVEKGIYFADSTNSIHVKDESFISLEYLIGLLNSKLYQWRFKLTSTNNNVGTNELKVLPIIQPNASICKKHIEEIESKVRTILTLKRDVDSKMISMYKNKIDDIIFTMFKLNDEEIKCINTNFKH